MLFRKITKGSNLWVVLICIFMASLSYSQEDKISSRNVNDNRTISIDFNSVDIDIFCKFVSEILGKNIVLSPGVKGSVTIQAPDKIRVSEFYDVFKSVMALHGYAIVEEGHMIMVKPINQEKRKIASKLLLIVFSHMVLWAVLLVFYPISKTIQSVFFWSPLLRRIIGFGYIDLILIYVAPIRRMLFYPFKVALSTSDKSAVESEETHYYYPYSQVTTDGNDERRSISEELSKINGQVLLVGESGLGKTMFLSQLTASLNDITVFLPAQQCREGVISAIQKKLHGRLKDNGFLKQLIYTGALTVIIDGLNEVNVGTRAMIANFIDNFPKCNMIISTQPIEWDPPKNLKRYSLLPLAEHQIMEFLIAERGGADARENKMSHDPKVIAEAESYLSEILDSSLSANELVLNRTILSNPMNLTIIRQMLIEGIRPDLYSLYEQYFRKLEDNYKTTHQGRSFPIKKFAESIYELRVNDDYLIPFDNFMNEIPSMEKEKMVICAEIQDSKGQDTKLCFFRHETISDYFIVQLFLESEELRAKHLSDERFRGIYFMLANMMSIDEALKLREEIIEYAAEHSDHNVCDEYVKILKRRIEANS